VTWTEWLALVSATMLTAILILVLVLVVSDKR